MRSANGSIWFLVLLAGAVLAGINLLGTGCAATDQPVCEPLGAVLGVIPARTPEDGFTALVDNGVAPLEFGSQGAWMLVLSVHVDARWTERSLPIEVALRGPDHSLISQFPRRDLPVVGVPGSDGVYLTNMYLPLEADDTVRRIFGWDGLATELTVRIWPGCDTPVELRKAVRLEVPSI